jgi:hypothetical protein
MKRALVILLTSLLLGGCYTQLQTTREEGPTDSPYIDDRPTVIVDPMPLPPPIVIIEVAAPVEAPHTAPAPTETRRDFGSTRGSTEQSSMGRSSSGGKTEGRGR